MEPARERAIRYLIDLIDLSLAYDEDPALPILVRPEGLEPPLTDS